MRSHVGIKIWWCNHTSYPDKATFPAKKNMSPHIELCDVLGLRRTYYILTSVAAFIHWILMYNPYPLLLPDYENTEGRSPYRLVLPKKLLRFWALYLHTKTKTLSKNLGSPLSPRYIGNCTILYHIHQDDHPRIDTYTNPFPCHSQPVCFSCQNYLKNRDNEVEGMWRLAIDFCECHLLKCHGCICRYNKIK
jgi:hypothetical protein